VYNQLPAIIFANQIYNPFRKWKQIKHKKLQMGERESEK